MAVVSNMHQQQQLLNMVDPKQEPLPEDGEDLFDDLKSESGFDEDECKPEGSQASPSDPSSNSLSTPLPASSNLNRRPTRKSTLTQQQKNQKRQRATQDQLGTLEVEFNKNPTPNASVRERIAQEINMTERSVQIWFQNRRAKIKNMAKKSIENGEECDAIPESMRRYLAMQALESGTPLVNAEYFTSRGLAPYANGGLMISAESNASKVMIYHLTCRSLTIGTWRRIGQTQLDLVIFYSPMKSMFTYYIQAENTGFRIEYPFSSIKSIHLDAGDKANGAEASAAEHGSIVIELLNPPFFTMDQGSNGWFSCNDFTEDHQASKVLTHRLGGHPKVLGNQLGKLTTLDSYINRFANAGANMSATVSANMGANAMRNIGMAEDVKPNIVSPIPLIDNRPSSQPSHPIQPLPPKFNDPRTFQMAPPPARGHKRQRSRSVPVAIEFGPRRQPLPPFMVHHQHQHHHVHHHNPTPNTNPNSVQPLANHQPNHIFAPVPQYAPQQIPFHPQLGVVHSPYQLDPTAGFNFDFNIPAPPSTTTGTTGTTPPSTEFEHSFLAPPFAHDASLSAPVMQHPFSAHPNHFLSPVVGSPNPHENSVSPLSALGQPLNDQPDHVSPLLSPPIVGQNPLFRSASADPRAPVPANDSYYNDFFDFNAGSFTNNSKLNGFDESTLSFADTINWPQDGPNTLDALLVDDPLMDPASKQPLSLPFRMSFPEQPKGLLPPATPPPAADVYEFADLVRLDPLTPEQEKISAR